jgi:transposase
MRRELCASKAEALLARLRPAREAGLIRLQLAHDHLGDIKALDARLKTIRAKIATLVQASGTGLTGLYGIGPVIAGRILAEVGDVRRFATKDKFATYNGTAPIDVSSGDQVRHRLSRAGNRRLNHAIHIPPPRQRGTGLLRTQTARGQDRQGSPALPQAQALRRHLPPAGRRQCRHNRRVRITYDRQSNAAYIHLTDQPLPPDHATTRGQPPPGLDAFIALDWRANQLIGIEVLDASQILPADLLDQAEIIS